MMPGPSINNERACWFDRPLGLAALILSLTMGAGLVSGQPLEFQGPYELSAGDATQHQLSRNPQGNLVFDGAGVLHLGSWDGGLATTPSTPSRVWWHRWVRSSGWTTGQQVDDSRTTPAQIVLGGRHPSLVLASATTVTLAWHDHRHCTAAGNWIDNVEIYGQEVASDRAESFGPLPGNRRLTQTANPGIGDNGYAPRQVVLPDGRVMTLWYDYGFNNGISDLFAAVGSGPGQLGPGPFDLASVRLTDAAARANSPAFTLVDGTVTTDGVVHLCWMGGVGVGDLYTATLVPPYTAISGQTVVATGVADFLDPPRIVAAPNGDVWIVAKDASAADGGQVALWRKPAGSGAFGGVIRPVQGPGPRSFPTVAFAGGNMILAYSDRSPARGVRVARLHPTTATVLEQVLVAPGLNVARVSIAATPEAVHPAGIALVAEEIIGLNSSHLRHWTTIAPAMAERGWELYE
jgi:hypothetical protein